MASKPQDIVNFVQGYVDDFEKKMTPIQKSVWEKVRTTVNQLTVDGSGNIKRTVSNFKTLTKLQMDLKSVFYEPKYQKLISSVNASISDILDANAEYYRKIDSSTVSESITDELLKQSYATVVSSLSEAGMSTPLLQGASAIVKDGINSGSSFFEMNKKLQEFMIGNDQINGKLVSYSKQIVSDTMHGVSRTYSSMMAEELNLKWYQYVGALVKTSRPFCIALEHKQWIHESELGKVSRGLINGKQVSLQGLMPDTNKENIINRCGGYNCTHSMIPVPEEFVPKSIRDEFDKKQKG